MELCTAIWNRDDQLVQRLLASDTTETNPVEALQELVPWNSKTGKSESGVSLKEIQSSVLKDKESDVYGALPLNLAVIRGSITIVRILLDKGACPFWRDTRGRSALICSIYGSCDTLTVTPQNYKDVIQRSHIHAEIAHLLLDRTAKDRFYEIGEAPQHGNCLRGISPLCLAAYLGKYEMAETLLEQNVSVDSPDANGATPLMYAARDGHIDVVKLLVQNGAQVDKQDHHGWTAIQYAKAFPDVVTLLAKSKRVSKEQDLTFVPSSIIPPESTKDLPVPPSTQPTMPPVMVSDTQSPQESKNEARPEMYDNQFQLFSAVKNGDLEAFKTALSFTNQTSVNFTDPVSGLTCLQYAARHRPFQCPDTETMIRLLVSAGADVNSKNIKTGKTVLHYLLRDPFSMSSQSKSENKPHTDPSHQAIKKMILSTMRFLKRTGVKVDTADNNGNRPIHFASRLGDPDILNVLLNEFNADAFVVNNKGKPPISDCTTEEGKHILSEWIALHHPPSIYISNLVPGDVDSHTQQTHAIVPVAPPTEVIAVSEKGAIIADFNDRMAHQHKESAKRNGAMLDLKDDHQIKVCNAPQSNSSHETKLSSDQKYRNSKQVLKKDFFSSSETVVDDLELEKLAADYPDLSDKMDEILDPCPDLIESEEPKIISQLVEMLSYSEQRNKLLNQQLIALETSSQTQMSELQSRILTLEQELFESESKRLAAKQESSQWKEFAENLELQQVQKDGLLSMYQHAYDTTAQASRHCWDNFCQLSSKVEDIERYQTKYKDWDDELNRRSDSVQEQMVYLDTQADLLRLNLQHVCEKVKREDNLLSEVSIQRRELSERQEYDGGITNDEIDRLMQLEDDEEDIECEIAALKRDQEAIQDQLEYIYQLRNSLVNDHPDISTSEHPRKRFATIDELLMHISLTYCDVFRTLSLSDDQINLPPIALIDVPPSSHSEMGFQFNLGPLCLSQIVDSCRARIAQLKDKVRHLENENEHLLRRAEESENCSRQAAAAAQEVIETNFNLESQIKKLRCNANTLAKRLEAAQTRRMKEICSIRENLALLAGSANQDDEDSLSNDEGILGQLRDLIKSIDPNLITQYKPSHGTHGPLLESEVEYETKESMENLNVYASQAIMTLSTVTDRLGEYVNLLFKAVAALQSSSSYNLIAGSSDKDDSKSGMAKSVSRAGFIIRKFSKTRRPNESRKNKSSKIIKFVSTKNEKVHSLPRETVSKETAGSPTPSSFSFDVIGHYADRVDEDESSSTFVDVVTKNDSSFCVNTPAKAKSSQDSKSLILSANGSVHQYLDAIAKLKSEIQSLESNSDTDSATLDKKKREHKRLVQELTNAMKSRTHTS